VHDIAGAQTIYGGKNQRLVSLDSWPTHGRQYQDRELVTQILVSGDERVELAFRCAEQFPVARPRPGHFVGGYHRVIGKCASERCGRPLIKQYSHTRAAMKPKVLRDYQALLGMSQDKLHLFAGHARKPLEEIVYARAAFEIFEQRFDGHTGVLE
jgi:hypothetical protein